ncbi:MAG: cation transporter [Elusimicrobia bacterium]|nr:cation transporter [Elusimicrobiota bacterium]
MEKKERRWLLAWPLVAIVLMGGTLVSAEPETVMKVQVKGLACPFCAYGLEKRLKETGAEKVNIHVDKGMAEIAFPERHPMKLEQLREAVKKGGFTPGFIEIQTVGVLVQKEGRWIFELAGSREVFLVKEDDILAGMKKAIPPGVAVQIVAKSEDIQEKGHGEHPPTLKILSYQRAQ